MHRDRILSIRGRRFHLTEWGPSSAPAVVMLHGLTGHARTWDDEAEALAPRYRVIAPDLRGHGDSDPAPDGDYRTVTLADDLAVVVDALALDHPAVVGLSMGGRAAIAYAGTHPGCVERLMVVDIGPEVAPAGSARIATLLAATPERFETVDAAVAFVRAGNARANEARLRHRVAHGLRPLASGGFAWKYDRAIRDAVRAGRWTDSVDLWPLWTAIGCPVLVVRGAESDVLSVETAKRMLETLPQARLVEVPDAGHTVPVDQPAAFLAIVREFLA